MGRVIRSRPTIARSMLLIAGLACLFGLLRSEHVGVFVFILMWAGLTWGIWCIARSGAKWALAVLLLLSGSTGGLIVLLCVVPFPMIGLVLPAMLAFGTAPWLVAGGLAYFAADRRCGPMTRRATSLLVLSLVSWPMATALTFWPLHLTFWWVRPELERLADRVAAGAPPAWPQRAGPYTFVGGAVDPRNSRNVALYVDANPSGPRGFVRLIGPEPQYGGTFRLIIPSDFDFALTRGWHFMSED